MTGLMMTASVCPAMEDIKLPRDDESVPTRSEAAAGMDQGLRVLSYLIAGVLVYGLLGWAGDHFLGTEFLLPIGIVAGAGFGVYVVIRRFGQVSDTPDTKVSHTMTEGER